MKKIYKTFVAGLLALACGIPAANAVGNATCATAQTLSLSAESIMLEADPANVSDPFGAKLATTAWYKFTATSDTLFYFSIISSDGTAVPDSLYSFYSGTTCENMNQLVYNPDNWQFDYRPITRTIRGQKFTNYVFTASAGTTYYLKVMLPASANTFADPAMSVDIVCDAQNTAFDNIAALKRSGFGDTEISCTLTNPVLVTYELSNRGRQTAVFIRDETGAMRISGPTMGWASTPIPVTTGDSISGVSGTFSSMKYDPSEYGEKAPTAMMVSNISAVQVLSSNNEVLPMEVSLADYAADPTYYESELITLPAGAYLAQMPASEYDPMMHFLISGTDTARISLPISMDENTILATDSIYAFTGFVDVAGLLTYLNVYPRSGKDIKRYTFANIAEMQEMGNDLERKPYTLANPVLITYENTGRSGQLVYAQDETGVMVLKAKGWNETLAVVTGDSITGLTGVFNTQYDPAYLLQYDYNIKPNTMTVEVAANISVLNSGNTVDVTPMTVEDLKYSYTDYAGRIVSLGSGRIGKISVTTNGYSTTYDCFIQNTDTVYLSFNGMFEGISEFALTGIVTYAASTPGRITIEPRDNADVVNEGAYSTISALRKATDGTVTVDIPAIVSHVMLAEQVGSTYNYVVYAQEYVNYTYNGMKFKFATQAPTTLAAGDSVRFVGQGSYIAGGEDGAGVWPCQLTLASDTIIRPINSGNVVETSLYSSYYYTTSPRSYESLLISINKGTYEAVAGQEYGKYLVPNDDDPSSPDALFISKYTGTLTQFGVNAIVDYGDYVNPGHFGLLVRTPNDIIDLEKHFANIADMKAVGEPATSSIEYCLDNPVVVSYVFVPSGAEMGSMPIIYVQDATGAIAVSSVSAATNGLAIGDSIKGLRGMFTKGIYTEIAQASSLYANFDTYAPVKLSSGNEVAAVATTVAAVLSDPESYESKLVSFEAGRIRIDSIPEVDWLNNPTGNIIVTPYYAQGDDIIETNYKGQNALQRIRGIADMSIMNGDIYFCVRNAQDVNFVQSSVENTNATGARIYVAQQTLVAENAVALAVYDVQGHLLNQVQANRLSVAAWAHGVLIVKAFYADGQTQVVKVVK